MRKTKQESKKRAGDPQLLRRTDLARTTLKACDVEVVYKERLSCRVRKRAVFVQFEFGARSADAPPERREFTINRFGSDFTEE